MLSPFGIAVECLVVRLARSGNQKPKSHCLPFSGDVLLERGSVGLIQGSANCRMDGIRRDAPESRPTRTATLAAPNDASQRCRPEPTF